MMYRNVIKKKRLGNLLVKIVKVQYKPERNKAKSQSFILGEGKKKFRNSDPLTLIMISAKPET